MRTLKKTIKLALLLCLVYVGGAIMAWEWHPADWHLGIRILISAAAILMVFLVFYDELIDY